MKLPKLRKVLFKKEESKTDSDNDSLFDRDENDENLLKSHLNRNEREKVKELMDQIHAQKKEDAEGESECEEEFERTSQEPEDMVPPVTREEIIPLAKIILTYCRENEIDIMDLPNVIFVDFSLTGKICISNLGNILSNRFGLENEDSQKLARYMIEQPENFENSSSKGKQKLKYKFNPDQQLSHAKVVSKLQTVIGSLT